MTSGSQLVIADHQEPRQDDDGVRAEVPMPADDHAGVVAGEQREVERFDGEGHPFLPHVRNRAVRISLTANLDVGAVGVIIGHGGEDRLEPRDARCVHRLESLMTAAAAPVPGSEFSPTEFRANTVVA